jgi:hypothetical protein
MKVGDPVRFYEDGDAILFHDENEWFTLGQIVNIGEQGVEVDFMDWVSLIPTDELHIEYFLYAPTLVSNTRGRVISDF